MGSGSLLRVIALALVLCFAPAVRAQAGEELAPGKFLVASRKLPDPNFAETVVVLLEYGDRGAVGLIVNRPTGTRVSAVLKDVDEAKGREDLLYAGGPVSHGGVLALRRMRVRPEGGNALFANVYLVATKAELQAALASGAKPSDLRVYAGYAGWGPGQLERELLMGAWHVMRADSPSVFSNRPENVWLKLIDQTDLLLASR